MKEIRLYILPNEQEKLLPDLTKTTFPLLVYCRFCSLIHFQLILVFVFYTILTCIGLYFLAAGCPLVIEENLWPHSLPDGTI